MDPIEARKIPQDYRIVYHGIEHEQYFQGHGIAFTKWMDCATGIGSCNVEALNDALEMLAQNGWDIEALENAMRKNGSLPSDKPDTLDDGMYYYVSINVK